MSKTNKRDLEVFEAETEGRPPELQGLPTDAPAVAAPAPSAPSPMTYNPYFDRPVARRKCPGDEREYGWGTHRI